MRASEIGGLLVLLGVLLAFLSLFAFRPLSPETWAALEQHTVSTGSERYDRVRRNRMRSSTKATDAIYRRRWPMRVAAGALIVIGVLLLG